MQTSECQSDLNMARARGYVLFFHDNRRSLTREVRLRSCGRRLFAGTLHNFLPLRKRAEEHRPLRNRNVRLCWKHLTAAAAADKSHGI